MIKRIWMMALGLCLCLGAVAQESVLKEAEKQIKKGESYATVLRTLTPAMSNATTKNDPKTYYLAGKAGLNEYDKLYSQEILGQLDDSGRKTKAEALLGGYDNMAKALSLNPDNKLQKEIITTLASHYNKLISAGVDLWQVQNYKGAYDAWGYYVSIAENPTFSKAIYKPTTETISEIAYNQALAAWQNNDLNSSLQSFLKAKSLGYDKKTLYDYAIAVASQAGDQSAIWELANEAYKKYGNEDSNYIGFIINGYLNSKQFTQALDAIETAITQHPNNAQFYVIQGILYEQDGINRDPTPSYEKAVELDPQNASALYNLGRKYYDQALNIYNDAPSETKTFNQIFNNDFKPVMTKAVDLLENSYVLGESKEDAIKLLENAAYLLNDDAKYEEYKKVREGKATLNPNNLPQSNQNYVASNTPTSASNQNKSTSQNSNKSSTSSTTSNTSNSTIQNNNVASTSTNNATVQNNNVASTNSNTSQTQSNSGSLFPTLTVDKFSVNPFDLSASKYQRMDLNDEACALLIVSIPLQGCVFSGNIIGDVEFHTNEYWVYLSPRSKSLKIQVPGFITLMVDFKEQGFMGGVESKTTYNLSFR